MAKMIINGEVCSGSNSYASAVEYIKDDGSKTTVQDELSELNKKNSSTYIYTTIHQITNLANNEITLNTLVENLPEKSILFLELWKAAWSNFVFPSQITSNYLCLEINKARDSYVSIRLHDLQANDMYICSKYGGVYTDWKKITTS